MLAKVLACGFLFLSCISNNSLKAQNDSAQQFPSKWDLQTCLDYAKRNNIQLNTLRFSQQINKQDLLLARAAKYPNLFGNLGQNFTHSTNANPVVGGFATQSSFASNSSLTSAWTVFNGGYLNYNIKIKNLDLNQAGLNIDQSINSLTIEITQDFLNILLAKENIIYVEDLVKTSEAQQDQGNKLYSAGSIARNALIELEAQTATDKYNLVSAQSAYRQNLLNLKQLLQLPWSYSLDIAIPDTIIATALMPSLDEVQRIALATRPEIKYAETGLDIAQMNLKTAKAQTLPVASIGASLATGYSNNESVEYLKQLDNNFYQRVGLSISIPIFNNRIYRTQIEVSKIEIEQAKLSLQGAKTTLSQLVEQAYINVLNAQAQYDAAVVQLKASQESYRVVSEQFKYGAANLVELLQQKNLYVQALQGYIQAKYTAALNLEIYNFYRGEPVKL
ncbi:TolC family protein [Pedobacter sp.]|jgi:outer membrane protein|uniref:TolC family protein n=1 Tax=Pedobacter sp. TaxID=1411316 RepID=UPI002CED0E8D|nr:TolC family protein [Pedobacter sp.]HWW37935.1 TolC family protein [Pedobacter sp.]